MRKRGAGLVRIGTASVLAAALVSGCAGEEDSCDQEPTAECDDSPIEITYVCGACDTLWMCTSSDGVRAWVRPNKDGGCDCIDEDGKWITDTARRDCAPGQGDTG